MFLGTVDIISKSVYVSLRMTNLVVCLAQAMTRKTLLSETFDVLWEIIKEPYLPQRSVTLDDSPGIFLVFNDKQQTFSFSNFASARSAT